MLHRVKWIAALVAIAASPSALAQGYPVKPVRIMVTFTQGGAADITARLVGEKLSEAWKQQVIIENRIGAGGNIGMEAVFRAPADGYTILMASNTHAINMALFSNLPFDMTRNFAGLGLTTSTPMVIAVNPRLKENNIREFTALLRSQPGKLSYTTCGIATAHHFAMEMYKYNTKTFAVHIPQRGCTPAVVDAVSGHVEVVIASLAAVLPQARQGRLKVLGVTTAERSPSAPDIPTLRESGVPELKDFAVENYYGFMVLAGTPKEILVKLETDINRVLAAPEMKQRLSNAGLDLYQSTPEQMMATLRSDIEKFKKAIEVAGIKPE